MTVPYRIREDIDCPGCGEARCECIDDEPEDWPADLSITARIQEVRRKIVAAEGAELNELLETLGNLYRMREAEIHHTTEQEF